MTAPAPAGGAQSAGTVLLSGGDVRQLVSMAEAIDVTGQAAIEYASGPISAVPRVGLPGGGTLLMAAASPERGGVAAKIVSITPRNRADGLATIQGLASWLDYDTRQPLLVADATAVTALRTGALSGVATRALAPADASVLAVVGAGGQALSQVEAVVAIRPIEQVRVVSLHRSSAERFRDRLAAMLPEQKITVCPDIATAVQDADVTCLATTATSALIEQRHLRPGAHVNAIGAYRPDMREVGVTVFGAASVVCADDPDGALREAGDLIDAVAAGQLVPDAVIGLGSVVRDGAAAQPGRGATVFKSVGSAAADLALLDLLRQRAGDHPELHRFDFTR